MILSSIFLINSKDVIINYQYSRILVDAACYMHILYLLFFFSVLFFEIKLYI